MMDVEVAVFGDWDTTNLGDRAIHEGVIAFCEGLGWRATSYGLGSLAPAVQDRVPVAWEPHSFRSMIGRAPFLKRTLREVRQRLRLKMLRPQLERAGIVLVGGGELLSDRNLHFPQSLALLADFASESGKPIYCLGCGAESRWSAGGRRRIRRFLAACRVVAARDETTAGRLTDLLGRPVPVFGDFALSESALAQAADSAERRSEIAINVQQLSLEWSAQQSGYERAVSDIAKTLVSSVRDRPPGLRIFTTGTPEDAASAERVVALLGGTGAQLVLPRSLDELYRLLDTSFLVVASRLHAAILGLAHGAAVFGFSPQPKLRRFFATFGIEDWSFGPEDAGRLQPSVQRSAYVELASTQRAMVLCAPAWDFRRDLRFPS